MTISTREIRNPAGGDGMYSLMVVVAAMSFATGGVAMKYADGLTRFWPSVIVFALFAAGAALQGIAMRGTALSVTYLVVLGLEAVIAFGLGVAFFQEGLTAAKVLGAGLVLVGTFLLRSGET
jgi:multidrug transporter EmrE-like cation transporter